MTSTVFNAAGPRPARDSRVPLTPPLATLLALAAAANLSFDESYYALWAEHPALGYLDHPPLVAWLLVPWVNLAHPWMLRMPMVLCGLVTAWCLGELAASALDEPARRRAQLLSLCGIPMLLVGALVSPDAPLVASGAVGLTAYMRAQSSRGRRTHWVVLGIALGTALLSKLTGALLWAVVAGHLLVHRRALLATVRPWCSALLGLLVSLPMWLWNAQNGWASFRFQASLGPRHLDHAPAWLTGLDFVAGQALVLGPVLVAGLLVLMRRWWRARQRPTAEQWLLVWTAGVPWAVCAVVSLRQAVEANWPLLAWLGVVPLVAAVERAARWQGRLHLALVTGLLAYLAHPFLPGAADFTARFVGWEELGVRVEACAAQEHLPNGWGVLTQSRREASQLHLYVAGHPTARPLVDVGRFGAVSAAMPGAVLVLEANDGAGQRAVDEAEARGWQARACGVAERRHAAGPVVERYALFALGPQRAHVDPVNRVPTASAWRP